MTGLGEAWLHNVNGQFIPSASEGGHADFAARTEREIDVLRNLIQRFGRAEVESVVSGPGLVNLHRVTHVAPCTSVDVRAMKRPISLRCALAWAAISGASSGAWSKA